MSMTNAYRGRDAVRDAGLALGLPGDTIDAIPKQMWRFNARDFRRALVEKPELAELAADVRRSEHLDLLVDLTATLDRLPHHFSVRPCGVVLSDASLLDRTRVQASWMGLPMSQFVKHRRLSGERIDPDRIPLEDPATFELIRSTRTLGVFQLSPPGRWSWSGSCNPRSSTT